MGLRFWAAGAGAVIIAMVAFAGPPAEAAPKKKGVAARDTQVVVTGRARTRITVQRRSFLDGGTEVIPGDRKFTDYAFPPGHSPASNIGIENTAFYRRSPLPGPFDLPSRQNPWPWNWCVGC